MPAEIPRPSSDELRAMIDTDMGVADLAAHYKASVQTINKWKRIYGLQTPEKRVRKKRRNLPVAEIRTLAESGLSGPVIAKRIGCSLDLLVSVMRDNGIRTRMAQAWNASRERSILEEQAVVNVTPSARAIEWANPFRVHG